MKRWNVLIDRILFTVTENEVHILHVRRGARLALGETPPEKE